MTPEPPAGSTFLPPSNLQQMSAFLGTIALRAQTVTSTRVTGDAELGPNHHTPWGIVHGGVYATAAETAAGVGASMAVAERGQIAVGVTNITNFLRPMVAGHVTVTATAIQQGRSQQLWSVEIIDDAGKLIAVSQVREPSLGYPVVEAVEGA